MLVAAGLVPLAVAGDEGTGRLPVSYGDVRRMGRIGRKQSRISERWQMECTLGRVTAVTVRTGVSSYYHENDIFTSMPIGHR